MARLNILNSVVARLVGCLLLGGLVLSAVLAYMEYNETKADLRTRVSHGMGVTVRTLQTMLGDLIAHDSDVKDIERALKNSTFQRRVKAARISIGEKERYETGNWPDHPARTVVVSGVTEQSMNLGVDVDLNQPTLVQAPFHTARGGAVLELVVDASSDHAAMMRDLMGRLWLQWLLLAVMTLLGLLLVRRWCTGPLSEVVELVNKNAGPRPFLDIAKRHPAEFSRLSESIGQMLTRLDQTARQLQDREAAFEDLYQFAPAAMVSLDPQGKIVEANRRAADLFETPDEKQLIGRSILDTLKPEDRSRLRQAIDRLDIDNVVRVDLRVIVERQGQDHKTIDILAECTGTRNEDGMLQRVRISLLDVSQSHQLQRELAEKSQLLNLLIDHMSDAILLVDDRDRVAAFNQQLCTLLRQESSQLLGRRYDPAQFWSDLGVVDSELFMSRLRQIDADQSRPAQERFETKSGTFLFQGIPVHDATTRAVGRLWVVREITSQEQNQRLLEQQQEQIKALRRLGGRLADIRGVDDLLERASASLHEVFGVEAVGLAIRRSHSDNRSLQIVNRGVGSYLLSSSQVLIGAVERHLMPMTLSSRDVMFWPDLPANLPWTSAFEQAGLTAVASVPLRGTTDAQGIIWIARRTGERLERHQLYLLEALAPVVAARLEYAQLSEQLSIMDLTDPVTDLPNQTQFEQMARRLQNRPGVPWSIVVVQVDHFRKLNEELDHLQADQVLRDVATGMLRGVRKSCMVARLAGPCMGVLCPEMDGGAAAALAERLSKVVAGINVTMPDGRPRTLTASLGVATAPQDAKTAPEIISLAIARVETAKRAGGNRVVVMSPKVDRQAG